MIKFIPFIPIAFAAHVGLAQSNAPTGLDAERNLVELGNSNNATMVRTYDNRYEGVKGSPFFLPEWAKARIAINNTFFDNVEAKYNVYNNELLYRNPKGEEYILMPSKVASFVLKDSQAKKEYLFKRYPALSAKDPQLARQYVVALYDGKQVQLVMVPQKRLVKATFKQPYSVSKNYDELQDEQYYYLLGPDNALTKVKLNKKSLLKALPQNQDKVEKYIAAERIDASDPGGWAKALAYYESL